MPTIKPIGYSHDRLVSGTAQFGNLAVAVINQDYGASPNDITFWATTDLDTGYNITVENPACDTPNNAGVPCCLSFYSTDTKDDTEFINLSNYLTGQGFTGATQAYSWLTNNGYWTSYIPNTPIYSEIINGAFIRQEYATNTDTIWTTKFTVGEVKVYNGPDFTTSTTVGVSHGGGADAVTDIIYGPNLNRIFFSFGNYGKVQMYNPDNNTLVTTISVGNDGNFTRTLGYNLTNSTVWMVSGQEDKVYVLSATTSSLTSITGITLTNFTAEPTSITWNSNRNLMYVGGSREIDVIDCDTNTKVSEINGLGENGYSILVDNLVYDPVHDRVYFGMTSLTTQTLKIYYLDCETNTVSAALHTQSNVNSSFTSMEYDINGYVWIGTSKSVLILDTTTNTVSVGDTQFDLSSDIIFKSSKNQMICARGSSYNALIYDVTTVY